MNSLKFPCSIFTAKAPNSGCGGSCPTAFTCCSSCCPGGKALPQGAMEGKACREMVHDFDKATFNQEKFDAVWSYLRCWHALRPMTT